MIAHKIQYELEKQGYRTSRTNSKVIMCINSQKLESFNYHISTNKRIYFKYNQKTYTPRLRPKAPKNKQICKVKNSLFINSLIPKKNERTIFYIIMRLFKEEFNTYKNKPVITSTQIIRCIHYLKVFKLLNRGEIERVISRYQKKSIIDRFINILEQNTTLPQHKTNYIFQECKCFIYYGRMYLCYRFFHKPLQFLLLSSRLSHHKITINKIQYFPLDILETIKPKKYKVIHNYFRYRLANVIAQYVKTLPIQII